MPTLHIRQHPARDGRYPVSLRLRRPDHADLEAEANVEFALTDQEQEDLRWYLEDYLQHADLVEDVIVAQIEAMMKARGEELYAKVLASGPGTQAVWFAIREHLADLRIEITTGVAEAASIPWELMRDPQSDSAISLRVRSFVRVQSNANIGFIPVPPADDGRVRLLYVVCRPRGSDDVELRAIANRLLHDLGADRARFHVKALRPPTFEQLQRELTDAKEAGRPYHVVHFDGHGVYADLEHTTLKSWLSTLSHLMLGGKTSGKHGYLLFEHDGAEKMRPVDGHTLGQLLHDTGSPVLVLNACQSAMHEATGAPDAAGTPHDEIRAIGSLAQAVIDQGIPAVLGMRYSVYVVTAAQYISELYSALARGREFGQAATEGRKHLQRNPDRWVGLQPRPLQDWIVPVVYEARPIHLLPGARPSALGAGPELDPVQLNPGLLRYIPEHGFTGRDETLLALDRAFDAHRVVLLHAYAGQGKTTTAVEFARWYALTGGLGEHPQVLFASFETHTDLDDLLNQVAQRFAPVLEANDVHWSAVNDASERRGLVLQLLRMTPVLWIWDNVEPVAGFPEGSESQWTDDEQRELREFLHQVKLDTASRAKVLLTSRRAEERWLSGIPHRIAMPRMRDSDAARLALSLGREKGMSPADIADWQPLLDYCRGNPLTLRVLVGQAVRMGMRGKERIEAFVEAIRSGEQAIEDADESEGRDRSLGASLDYGFRHAFSEDELPIIALLHLFQGTVDVDALRLMGKGAQGIRELHGKEREELTALLERARDTGLLTHVGSTYFSIHPALPWFLRQLFAHYFDGQNGRSSATAALYAWIGAIATLSNIYHDMFEKGRRDVIQQLELEEANLLLARQRARDHQSWTEVISAMQGLYQLYEYQGRDTEWSRLVTKTVPDYCTGRDEPITGREDEYKVVMQYRIILARRTRNLDKAAGFAQKLAAAMRQQSADVLALPSAAILNPTQRLRLHSLTVALFTHGFLLMENGDAACVDLFQESLQISLRIEDVSLQAVIEFNLGHIYKDISSIRDLDAAEAAYKRSLELRDRDDRVGRCRCMHQIGMVYHTRFREAQNKKEPVEVCLAHAKAAQDHYIHALELCPEDAITQLAPLHNQLGLIYKDLFQYDTARRHYEQALVNFERSGDYYWAGLTRDNIAMMYMTIASQETDLQKRRVLLLRAEAYVKAALRDLQKYQDRTTSEQTRAQQRLDLIHKALG